MRVLTHDKFQIQSYFDQPFNERDEISLKLN